MIWRRLRQTWEESSSDVLLVAVMKMLALGIIKCCIPPIYLPLPQEDKDNKSFKNCQLASKKEMFKS